MKKILSLFLVFSLFLTVALKAQNNCFMPNGFNATLHVPSWQNTTLTWDNISDTATQHLRWCTSYSDRMGMDTVADMIGVVRFTVADLVGHGNHSLTSVSFVPGELQSVCNYSIMVWQGGHFGNGITPGTLLVEKNVTQALTYGTLNTVYLDAALAVDTTQELWIGVRCVSTEGLPLGVSSNTAVTNKGELFFTYNTWVTLSMLGISNYNWMIIGELTGNDYLLTGFNVYRNGQLLTSTPVLANSYVDTLSAGGSYTYGLTAVYQSGCESNPATSTVTLQNDPCASCQDSLLIGTSIVSSQFVPTNPVNNFSYTQQIYLSSELGNLNSRVNCLAFQYMGTSPMLRHLKIYMGNTAKSSFVNNTDWIPVNQMMLVFDGDIYFSSSVENDYWVNVPLDIPFEWDGTNNVVIAISDETGHAMPSMDYFLVHAAASRTLCAYRDDTPYAPATSLPNGMVAIKDVRNNILLREGAMIFCNIPTDFKVSNITDQEALVKWNPNGMSNDYELAFVPDGMSLNEVTPISVSDTFYYALDLIENTAYTAYLRAVCPGENSSWITYSFHTHCMAEEILPFVENFDSYGAGSEWNYPGCWSRNNVSYRVYPFVDSTADGHLALTFYSDTMSYSMAVSQMLDLSNYANAQLALTFKLMKSRYNFGRLDVGIMTDPQDMATFTLLKSFVPGDYEHINVWYDKSIFFVNDFNEPIYLVLYAPEWRSDSSFVFLDDVKLEPVTGCSNLSDLHVSHISGTSAIVRWNLAPYGVSSYVVEYAVAGQQSWQRNVAANNEARLTGLAPQTQYSVRVFSDCVGSDTLYVSFVTGCAATSDQPYAYQVGNGSETFNRLPVSCLSSNSFSQQIYLASEMNGAGYISALSVYLSSADNRSIWMDVDLTMTSETLISNWIPFQQNTRKVYTGRYTFVPGWNRIVFDEPFYYNGTDNLVVSFDNNNGVGLGPTLFNVHAVPQGRAAYVAGSIDDVNPEGFTLNPILHTFRNNMLFDYILCDTNCSCLIPNAFVAAVDDQSVLVDWVVDGSANNWDLEYKNAADTVWSSAGVVGVPPVTIFGLSSASDYDFRIRSACNSQQVSPWVILHAHTECLISSLPYFENFSNVVGTGNTAFVDCWKRYSNYSRPNTYVHNTQPHSSPNSLFMRGYDYAYSLVVLPRLDDNIPVYNLNIQFYAMASSEDSYVEVGIMRDPEDMNSFELLDRYDFSNEGVWTLVEVFSDNYQGDGRYVAFRIPQNTHSEVDIDDLIIQENAACPHIEDVTLTSISSSSATITWTAGGGEHAWGYLYGLANTVDPYSQTPLIASSNQLNLMNLVSNTTYDVYVMAACDSTSFSNPVSFSFTTPCDPLSTLFYENFDSIQGATSCADNVLPSCWNYLNTGTESSYAGCPTVYRTANAQSSPNALFFNTRSIPGSAYADQYAILPLVNDSLYPLNQLQLEFEVRKFSNNYDRFTLYVGVMTNMVDASSFMALDTFVVYSDSYTLKTVSFGQYTGSGYVVMMAPKEAGVVRNGGFVDNLVLGLIPSCPRPQDVTVSDETPSTVTLDWTSVGTETSWHVKYGPEGFNPDAEGTMLTVQSHPVLVQNLVENVTYDFYVQADCGDADLSSWSIPITGSTIGCYAPTNLHSLNPQPHSATLAWNEEGYARQWELEYRKLGENTWNTVTVSTNPYTLAGLDAASQYDARLYSVCFNDLSAVSNTIRFATVSDGILDYERNVLLYPNPTTGQLVLDNGRLNIDYIEIFDAYGKLLSIVKVGNPSVEISCDSYADGLYFVRVVTENGIVTKSFVKK